MVVISVESLDALNLLRILQMLGKGKIWTSIWKRPRAAGMNLEQRFSGRSPRNYTRNVDEIRQLKGF